jgi:hypothetical protein
MSPIRRFLPAVASALGSKRKAMNVADEGGLQQLQMLEILGLFR